ncbi:MAG: Omp28-related outer membrane protein [Flavobacteriaceae bacterium]
MKKIFIKSSLLLLFVNVIFIGCSKKESFDTIADFSLVLTSSSADGVLLLNEELTFTVLTEEGVDYTNEATFFVNGSEINVSSYNFSAEGTYEVYASYLGVVSNTLAFEVIDGTSRILLLSNAKVLRNQEVSFDVVDASGNNYNDTGTFYVNGNPITGNIFSSTQTGSYEVYAEYTIEGENFTSETKTFQIFIPKRKVVVEDYTGAWCGYCPAVSAAIENVYDLTSNITSIAIHNNDELALSIEPALRTEFGVFGFPSGRINRTTTWGSGLNFPTTAVTSLAGLDVATAISISSSVTNGNLAVKVSLISENDLQNTKLVVYLTEDGIPLDQTNYFNGDSSSPYFGLGDPIIDFEQNHVLRASLTNAFGNEIPSTNALTTYETSFNYEIPSNFVNEKLSIVVMLVDTDNNALNSQYAKVGEDKGFE